MLNQTLLGGLVVVRGNGQQTVCTCLRCKLAQLNGVSRVIGTGTCDNRNAAIDMVDTKLNGFLVLLVGQGRALTGGAADGNGIKIVVYNVPSRTGMTIKPETYFELSKHPNINGAKEASGDFSLLAEAMRLCGDNLNFWSGNDDMIVPLMAMGGKGVISVLANVAPDVAHNIAQLCLDGKYAEAREMQIKYLALINALFVEVNPIPVKMAVRMLGWDVGELRMPLCDMSAEHTEILRKAMTEAGYAPVK